MGGSFSKKKNKPGVSETDGKGKHNNPKHQANGHDDEPTSKANGTGSKTPTSDTKSTPSQTDESDIGDDIVRGSKKVGKQWMSRNLFVFENSDIDIFPPV